MTNVSLTVQMILLILQIAQLKEWKLLEKAA